MFSSSVSSMNANSGWMNNTAHNVANVNTKKFAPIDSVISEGSKENPVLSSTMMKNNQVDGESATDITKEMTDMISSSKGFAVNVPVIKTQDEMLGTLLNMKA
jgi:flagellar hook protein FlgE